MIARRDRFFQQHHRLRNQRVIKLYFVRIKAMDTEQCDMLQQVLLELLAIIHIHEFSWYQPYANSIFRHPSM